MVKSLISECEDKHGEVKIKQAAGYMEVDDPNLLDELLAQNQVAELVDERLSDKTAAISAPVFSTGAGRAGSSALVSR